MYSALHILQTRSPLWLGATVLIAAATACSSAAAHQSGTPAAHSHTPAVMVGTARGIGKVLVASDGATLYVNNRDSAARLACTAACQVFWHPLTVSTGQQLASTPAVAAVLSTRKVSSGGSPSGRQVTFHGRPLYTFTLDRHSGEASGNGFSDQFDGTRFTWLAATPTGAAAPAGTASTPAAPNYPNY